MRGKAEAKRIIGEKKGVLSMLSTSSKKKRKIKMVQHKKRKRTDSVAISTFSSFDHRSKRYLLLLLALFEQVLSVSLFLVLLLLLRQLPRLLLLQELCIRLLIHISLSFGPHEQQRTNKKR